MKENINSYLITILVVLMSVGAAWFIMHVANGDTANKLNGSEANYSQLKQSILNN